MKLLNLLLHLIITLLQYYAILVKKTRLKFDGSCLRQNKITLTHAKTVNIYIVYERRVSDSNNNYPTLENILFGAVKIVKNADFDKYK